MLLEKNGTIPLRTFEVEAFKVGIILNNRDSEYMAYHFSEPGKISNLRYEDVIKELTPIVQSEGTM